MQRPLLRSTPLCCRRRPTMYRAACYGIYNYDPVVVKKLRIVRRRTFEQPAARQLDSVSKVSESETSRPRNYGARRGSRVALPFKFISKCRTRRTRKRRIPPAEPLCSANVGECQTGSVEVCSYNSVALSAICL